jgi:Cof subfamily protein (haloacid dehalogenase superfamily)
MPKRPRLIATDLDGTLFRAGSTISDFTMGVLRRADAAGILLQPVTGRPPRTVAYALREVDLMQQVVAQNGAVIFDRATGDILASFTIAPPVAWDVVARVRDGVPGITFAVEALRSFGCEARYAELRSMSDRWSEWRDDDLMRLEQPLTKIIGYHAEVAAETLLPLVAEIAGAAVCCTHSGVGLVEISAAGVDKASALAWLCAREGIAPEEVIAFGDMPNDLPMLRWAGRGVAVANAHPSVLAGADEIAASNEEDGVARVIAALLDAV